MFYGTLACGAAISPSLNFPGLITACGLSQGGGKGQGYGDQSPLWFLHSTDQKLLSSRGSFKHIGEMFGVTGKKLNTPECGLLWP